MLAWIAAVFFIPTLALVLGVWSGSRRAFEVIYTSLWYLRPLNGVPVLDYICIVPASLERGIWQWVIITAFALLLALFGRFRRQVRWWSGQKGTQRSATRTEPHLNWNL